MIDSQSVKATESGGICGYDAGKKIKGRKRHILTDTCGFLVFILVHAADIQDRDGAVDVLKAVRFRFPWLRHVFADGGDAGDKLKTQGYAGAHGRMDPRDHQAIRYRKRLRAPAPAMGGRGDIRLAWSMPPTGKRLGNFNRFFNRLGSNRLDPNAHPQNREILLRVKTFKSGSKWPLQARSPQIRIILHSITGLVFECYCSRIDETLARQRSTHRDMRLCAQSHLIR